MVLSLKKAHRNCYYKVKSNILFGGRKMAVNNKATTYLSILIYFFLLTYVFFANASLVAKIFVAVVGLAFPLYRFYVYYKFEKLYT